MIDEKKLIEELKPEVYKAYIDYKMGHEYWDKGYMDGLEFAIHKIESLMKDGGWIPAKERLPKEPKQNPKLDDRPMEMYLVDNGEDYPFRAFWNGKYFHDGWRRLDVLAWMPLPEPYRVPLEKDSKKLEKNSKG